MVKGSLTAYVATFVLNVEARFEPQWVIAIKIIMLRANGVCNISHPKLERSFIQ